MKKISEMAANAFNSFGRFNQGNTLVTSFKESETSYLYLHGNCIAFRKGDKVEITTDGWNTNTTKERLNAIGRQWGFYIQQKDWQFHLNNRPWGGKWTDVKEWGKE